VFPVVLGHRRWPTQNRFTHTSQRQATVWSGGAFPLRLWLSFITKHRVTGTARCWPTTVRVLVYEIPFLMLHLTVEGRGRVEGGCYCWCCWQEGRLGSSSHFRSIDHSLVYLISGSNVAEGAHSCTTAVHSVCASCFTLFDVFFVDGSHVDGLA
jgi:hypothetical protein